MARTLLFATLLVLPRVHAQEPAREPEAVALLQRAIAAQGKLPDGGIRDLQITFEGQIHEPDQGEHSITRKYWFRGKDRSFRIQTFANVDQAGTRSERGVLGDSKPTFWEWFEKSKKRVVLKPTNREHRKNIRAIQRDREDFERIVRMVVLARAEEQLTRVARAKPARSDCKEDQPNSRGFVFPKSLEGSAYHVLDLQRSGSDPLRIFISEKDLTVRKVVQFDRDQPGTVRFVYYLGAYRDMDGLKLPHYVSVHSEVPREKTREETTRLSGRLTLHLNPGLDNSVFAAEPPAKIGENGGAGEPAKGGRERE